MKMRWFFLVSFFAFSCFSALSEVGWKSQKIVLNANNATYTWQFKGIDPQKEGAIKIPEYPAEGWRNFIAPGDVNVELMKQKVLPDLLYDTLARQANWVTEKEWWFRLEFDANVDTAKNADLVFDFADGTSEVWLNGTKLGEMKNSFYPHRFNIKKIIRHQKNQLYVRFLSINELMGGKRLDEVRGWNERRAFLRKTQFNFGWDWALPLPGIGFAENVFIENGSEFQFTDFGVHPFIEGRVDMNFEVSKQAKQTGYEIQVTIQGHGSNINDTIDKKTNSTYKSYQYYTIAQPQLWWPNGYGDQPLYNYEAKLIVGGVVTDVRKGKFGIRETRIHETPFSKEAGHGYSFEVLINNEQIFCKGSNWIPMEIWPASIRPEKYRFYLEKAKEANFNMIRVWGGGIYERDLFYEICDELGLMVWQDFMFASAGFPATKLMDEIIPEAKYQISRLKNHPSIVLWCGTNEDVNSWKHPKNIAADEQSDVLEKSEKGKWKVDRVKEDEILYTMILRGLVGRFALDVPFVESSPMSREDFGNMPNSGNSHISSWKFALFECGENPARWRNHFNTPCSFDSEFCIQGPSNENTIKSFFEPQNLWPPNDAWIFHIQRGHANLPHYQQTMFIAGDIFGKINSLHEYVKFGQATHLEQTRSEYESARYDRPNNGGTMSWMFNDCWPTSNWSIIDYYYQPKPAYYAAKRACKPVLPIIFERDSIIRFAMANETAHAIEYKAVFGQQQLSGKTIWKDSVFFNQNANCTHEFSRINTKKSVSSESSYYFLSVVVNGIQQDVVSYFADGWKNIPWEEPKIKITLLDQKQGVEKWETKVKISTDKYARLVRLIWKNAELKLSDKQTPSLWFDDNFFDLLPGLSKEVLIYSTDRIKLNELETDTWVTD